MHSSRAAITVSVSLALFFPLCTDDSFIGGFLCQGLNLVFTEFLICVVIALADGAGLYGNSYKITIEWQRVTFVRCFNSEHTFWSSPLLHIS